MRQRFAGLSRRFVAALTFGVSTALAACVTAPVNADRSAFAMSPALNAVPSGAVDLEPSRTLLLDVRLDRQVASNGCGAHAVSSMVDYWARLASAPGRDPDVSGIDLLAAHPPADDAGYSLAEVVDLLVDLGLEAAAVQTDLEGLKREVDVGRPVIARVSAPAAYVWQRSLIPAGTPLLHWFEATTRDRSGRVLEGFSPALVDHYWVVVGHTSEHILVMDPALGVRAIRNSRFDAVFRRGGRLAVVVGGWSAPDRS